MGSSAQNSPSEAAATVVVVENSTAEAAAGAVTSCWKKNKKKKSEDVTFLEGLKYRWDDFKNASMDERKACFKNTFQSAFGVSKILGKNNHNSETTKSEVPLTNSS